MRKFSFRKNQSKAADRSLQEKLVNEYFEDLKLGDAPIVSANDAEFDGDKVYDRIITAIDTPHVQPKSNRSKWVVAASLAVGISVTALFYTKRDNVLNYVSPVISKQIVAANGQVASITLGDGTHVWLNSGSKLTYPDKFRGSLREIKLEGEAFLDVAHDDKKAFVIHTGDIKTQVLGTSFNVKAYADDDFVKVDVLTGKVGVLAHAANTVFLTPAEEVVINKKDHSAVKTLMVDVNTLTAWKDGELVFKNMMLPEVLSTLQRRFNVQLKADANLSQCSISANFTKVSLQNIMVIISRLVKGKAVQDRFGYRIKGKGC